MNMYTQITSRTRALSITLLCMLSSFVIMPAAIQAATPEQTATAWISSELYVQANNTISATEEVNIHNAELMPAPIIRRRFGTEYTDALGNTVKRRIVLHDVRIDGRKAEWELVTLPDAVLELQIKSEPATELHSKRAYTISYTVDDAVTFAEAYDQLFWQVTGRQWGTPIAWARVIAHFPESLQATDVGVQFRTGTPEQGDTGALFHSAGNTLTGITQRTLEPGEEFSILLQLPKGHILEPNWITTVWWRLQDNKNLIIYLATLLVLFVYYYLAWYFFGRDPEPKAIVPQYEPPEDLSPAALAYVLYMRSEKRGLAAALLSLAQRGYISLTAREFDHTITRTGKPIDQTTPPEETAVLYGLFATTGTAPLSTADPVIIPKAHRTLAESLKAQLGKRYFRYNTGIVLFGLGTSWTMGQLLDYYPIPSYGVWVWTLLIAVINIGFGLAMPTRTEAGKRLLEQIYGFRDFLQTAEQDRLNFHHAPNTRTQHLDAHLPYVVALGVPHTGTAELIQGLESMSPSEDGTYMRSYLSLNWDGWRADLFVLLKRVFRRLRGPKQAPDNTADQHNSN